MGNKLSSAVNQQATSTDNLRRKSSETIRQTPFPSKNEVQSYFLGALHDGTLNKKRRFRIAQKERKWLVLLKQYLRKLGYNSWIYQEGKQRNVFVLETLADFLDFRADPIKLKTKKEKIGYLRGFFDAEGGMPHNSNDKFYIQLVQNDKEKLKKIKRLLIDLRIKTGIIHNPSKKVDPGYWRMYVLKQSRSRFLKIIGSWHPKKLETIRKRMKI